VRKLVVKGAVELNNLTSDGKRGSFAFIREIQMCSEKRKGLAYQDDGMVSVLFKLPSR